MTRSRGMCTFTAKEERKKKESGRETVMRPRGQQSTTAHATRTDRTGLQEELPEESFGDLVVERPDIDCRICKETNKACEQSVHHQASFPIGSSWHLGCARVGHQALPSQPKPLGGSVQRFFSSALSSFFLLAPYAIISNGGLGSVLQGDVQLWCGLWAVQVSHSSLDQNTSSSHRHFSTLEASSARCAARERST